MRPEEFLERLEEALAECRFGDAEQLVDRMELRDFTVKHAKRTLDLVRRKRLFPLLERAASRFYDELAEQPLFRRQYAQALIDQGRVTQGLAVLRTLLPKVVSDPVEGPEVRGLIGRAHKQLFVDGGEQSSLLEAIEAYRGDWEADPGANRWHGINLVACLCRATVDGVRVETPEDAGAIARRILADIGQLDEPPVWDYATAMEAAVALGDKKKALRWARQYVRHPKADAFELGSTVRQLVEVWRLPGDDDLGAALLPVLEYELLQRQGGAVEVPAAAPGKSGPSRTEASKEGFESVYGNEGYQHLTWLDTLYSRAKAIGRVVDRSTGAAQGTGFLVRGEELHPDWGSTPVLLTNSHVVSEDPADQAALRPNEAAVEFTRLPGRPRRDLGELLFSDPRVAHDVSVLRILGDPLPEAAPLPVSLFLPALSRPGAEPQRVYVVGHPEGGELVATLYDNDLSEYESPYVRYRCPTRGGHSGSPVFNRRWDAFAIHHKAREDRQLNEGVLFESIKAVVGARRQPR